MTTPTRETLRLAYRRILRTLRAERAMRDKVFPPGHKQRDQKLADIEQAIADLATLGEGLRAVLGDREAEAVQETLLDVPAPKGHPDAY